MLGVAKDPLEHTSMYERMEEGKYLENFRIKCCQLQNIQGHVLKVLAIIFVKYKIPEVVF